MTMVFYVALASASPSAPLTGVILLKYHQVAGTTATFYFKQGLNYTAVEQAGIALQTGHQTLKQISCWAQNGVPSGMFVSALMRHPVEKFLSAFFKHQFPSVPNGDGTFDHFAGSKKYDRILGTNRSLADFHNLSRIMTALEIAMERSARGRDCEYSGQSGSVKAAMALLDQFSVVGVTERFHEWLSATCHGLGDLALPNCAVVRKINHRASVGHPKMSDFPEHFQTKLLSYVQCDMPIYEMAKKLSASASSQLKQIKGNKTNGLNLVTVMRNSNLVTVTDEDGQITGDGSQFSVHQAPCTLQEDQERRRKGRKKRQKREREQEE